MGRRRRAFQAGVPSHLTARGIDDQPIFLDELDRIALLAGLKDVVRKAELQAVAWCFMTTHYHLIVLSAVEPRISWAMQTLNSVYARHFNKWHGRRGHLFGERFTDDLVDSEDYLEQAIGYVPENPVRAGLVRRVEGLALVGSRRARAAAKRTRGPTHEVLATSPARAQEKVMAAEKKPAARKTTTEKKVAATKAKVVRTRKPKVTAITEDQIAERAYYIWVSGRGGDAAANWLQAERELTTA